ncbi:MAG: hypothetical protein HY525_04880 [Betaproteobacteria bacterium]|nr:hypothetical protein [Betaproteobacteria bacterium]
MKTRTLLLLRFNIVAEKEDELNKWYDEVHLPSVVACPGFLSGRRFRANTLPTKAKGINVGKVAKYMTLYELESPAAYETKEFQQARGFREFVPFLSDVTLEMYEEIKCIEKEE